jgi:IS5 family transposase
LACPGRHSTPRPGRSPRQLVERQRGFRRLVKWRTGCEGRISCLKHRFGWDRTRMDGIQGARIWCGHGVFAHNLVKSVGCWRPGTARRHEHPEHSSSHPTTQARG